MATTDFELILDGVEDLDDAYCLDQTIRTGSDYDCYHYSSNDDRIFISSDLWDDTLMLANEKSKNLFLKMLEERWSDEGLSIEVLYDFNRQMAKDD